MPARLVFSLPKIGCISCVTTIEKIVIDLKETLGFDWYTVDSVSKKLSVGFKGEVAPSNEVCSAIVAALQAYECVQDIPLKSDVVQDTAPNRLRRFLRAHWIWGGVGTGAGLVLLMLSMFLASMPLLANIIIAAISVPLIVMLGAESYVEAAKKLFKAGELTMDTLFAMSTLTVIGVSIAALFIPWLPMMFDAGLLIFGFRHMGLAIEESIKKNIGLRAEFKDRLPKQVKVERFGEVVLLPIEAICLGDIVLIDSAEVIPFDGEFESDTSSILETIITGSPLPRPIERGEKLLAGMVVDKVTKPLRLRVTGLGRQSYLAQLDEQIAKANSKKAPLETATKRILQYFIPAVLILALLSFALVSLFFSWSLGIICGVSVLVSACPCTLGFITPLAVKIGMAKAADHGVQFKSEEQLQKANQIDGVVFDLHGTLTKGYPVAHQCAVFSGAGLSRQELLRFFYVLEQRASHAMAKPVCDYVIKEDVAIPTDLEITEFDEKSNRSGLTARINDQSFVLGNRQMMEDAGVEWPADDSQFPSIEVGDNVVYLAREKKILGYILLKDPLRENALHTVNSLKALGKKVYICTGADAPTAMRYAEKLDIPCTHVFPSCVGLTHKKSMILQLQKKGRMAMIGDASNDALAISTSDFGVAIQSHHGDKVTQDEAGAVIHGGSLLPVVSAFAVAKQTVSNIKQNLITSISYNLITVMVAGGLLLSLGVILNPGIGVALMVLQTCLILLNAYRFKRQNLEHLKHLPEPPAFSEGTSHLRLVSSMPTMRNQLQADETPPSPKEKTHPSLLENNKEGEPLLAGILTHS